MAKTIQLGIDLGTTNSAIVLDHDGKTEIIKNTDHLEYTPSVFGYNKGENLQVGKKAYDQLFEYSDEENVGNYKAEVKRLMGTDEKVYFSRVGEELSAEEISAHILKYLKECVLRKYPNVNTDGVVITVPAYFTTTQKEATTRAGKIAGFKHIVLLQEPIAGAIAYAGDNEMNGNWLVYDLGGGTFDVAIISNQDGTLTVKGHAGDNYLGGKDFDKLIVDEVILKVLKKKYELSEILGTPKKCKAFINKLKYSAETAKKELTDAGNTMIVVDNLKDDNNDDIYEEIEFSRNEFEQLIAPKVKDSIELCKKAIEESGLSNNNIDKVILVGGSTMTPYIRSSLEKELGISVDSSADPLTVVAKGACIFGKSQIIPDELSSDENIKAKKSDISIKLNYEPVVSDTDTTITGKIEGLDEDEIYYIRIQSEDGSYSSNKIKVKNGKFLDTVSVRKGQVNNYSISLLDDNGNIIPTNNDSFSITHGVSIAGVPLSYSVSIALAKKGFFTKEAGDYCEVIWEKGSTLPLEQTETYRTARYLKKGDTENGLPIRIYEGESKKPDRNDLICEVSITGDELPYDLKEGSDVELTIKMDESGNVRLSAYFPDIDFFKEEVTRTEHSEEVDKDDLREDIENEEERFENMQEFLTTKEKEELKEKLRELKKGVQSNDTDTQNRTSHELKQFKKKLDQYEDATEGNKQESEFKEILENLTKMMKNFHGEEIIESELKTLEKEGRDAINHQDRDTLEHVIEEMRGLFFKVLYNTAEGLKILLKINYDRRYESRDPQRVERILTIAVRYIENDDIGGMQQCLQEIRNLMPDGGASSMSGMSFSGITH